MNKIELLLPTPHIYVFPGISYPLESFVPPKTLASLWILLLSDNKWSI